MKYPCPGCGDVIMAHPANHCADCYLAAQVVAGTRDREQLMDLMIKTGQSSRVLSITTRINMLESRNPV